MTSRKVRIPDNVANAANDGLLLLQAGYKGGTSTGWRRARQLASEKTIDVGDLADMRAWFARHGPDASNGGTSYAGYRRWVRDGRPFRRPQTSADAKKYRGAVAWLIWGGDAAYVWLKTPKVRALLLKHYPRRKEASTTNNLTI